ncbi:hypothetical protein MAPG_07204 [Magnaporthiopsis poae ATCC 64411]|uniref:NACHT domain-containing protein n=1 Tax=Magnaporthiopsis poae (strain ATCC 64411 / 73-15) TaxID=644358 RepID=A0A0C4E417_MAGP6|nr:hypothetical protein MAPG_07204 [Magnaporthiopsis poae ATCC 64411]
MSGLEPIAALGLACNILQVVQMGIETVSAARRVYKDGELDPALKHNGTVLQGLSDQILSTTTAANVAGSGQAKPKPQDQQIFNLATKSQRAARDLVEEVDFLSGESAKGNLVATLKVMAKTAWRKKRLDKLEGNLKEAERLLQMGLLTKLDERSRRIDSGTASIAADLHAFVDDYRKGRRDAILHVSAEADVTRKHTTKEITKIEKAVKLHVTQSTRQTKASVKSQVNLVLRDVARREDVASLEAKRARLLQSLNFDRMNERRSLVTSSHPGTFEWVLKDGSDDNTARKDGEREDDDGTARSDGEQEDDDDTARSDGEQEDDDDTAQSDGEREDIGHCEITWDSFVDWLRSTATTYWISGKPGAGKTTLMKYLVAQPKIRGHLRQWNAKAVVISHFFWRPGTPMQQSIKGLLCSLLHQLFSEMPASMDRLLRGHELVLRKGADTDWSNEELMNTLHDVMRHYPSPVVMFLDGLDEVLPQDGTLQLLEVTEELEERYGKAGRLKLCLGSRREPLLLRRLAAYPQLRLEQVNLEDLRRYGKDKLTVPPDYQITSTPEFWDSEMPWNHHALKEWLVDELVWKAEGVFLWLCLTVKTLSRALHRGETVEDLRHRIDALPEDLMELYKDMWSRADVETPRRREIAALCLQLALAHGTTPNIFHFMVATNPEMRRRLLELDIPTHAPAPCLIQACETTLRELESTCAGLLECPTPRKQFRPRYDERGSILIPWHGKEYDVLVPYVNRSSVSFAHRTAQDFLIDTVEGQRMLHNGAPHNGVADLRYAEAKLAELRLFRTPHAFLDPHQRFPYAFQRRHERVPKAARIFASDVHGILSGIVRPWDDSVKHSEDDLVRLLLQCEQVFNEGCSHTPPTVAIQNVHLEQQPGQPVLVGSEEIVRRQNEYWIRLGYGLGPALRFVWEMIQKMVETRNLDGPTKSELLVLLCTFSVSDSRDQSHDLEVRLAGMRHLLRMGASASWNGLCPFCPMWSRTEMTILRTPINALVSSMWEDVCRCSGTRSRARQFLDHIALLAANGADLGEEVQIYVRLTYTPSGRGDLEAAPVYKGNTATVGFTSMPHAKYIYVTVILACPASTLIAMAVQLWGLSDLAQLDALFESPEMMESSIGSSRPVAVTRDRGDRIDCDPPWPKSQSIYPLPSDGSLDETPLRLARFAEQAMKDGSRSTGGGDRGGIKWQMRDILIPPDLKVALNVLFARLESEAAPLEERIEEFGRRLGVCTPYEEWEGFSDLRTWEGDELEKEE